jgi:DNA-binding CsgD family transcriptional regulator/ligand-binding sensor protein
LKEKGVFADWAKRVGKGKIQAYQDSFARTFGISLCLLSLEGKTLTIWSNSSLFCYDMMKNNRSRCIQERENAARAVLAQGQTRTFRCYLGLTFFISPIYYRGKIICVAYGGGVKLAGDQVCVDNRLADHIATMTEQQLTDILELLQNTLELLDFDADGEAESEPCSENIPCSVNEYFLLKHKLSRREMDIAREVCACLSNKQIGEKLYISETTVKSHISNILAKTGMKDRMQLVMFCKEHNRG